MAGDPAGASDAARERDRLTIEALRRERKALETIIDTIPDFIFVKDAGGRFQIANQAWLQARGRTPAEIMGKTTFDLYPRAIAERMDAQDQAVMRSGVPQIDREQMVVTERHGAQERVWVSTTKVPLRDENGNIAGVVGISRDITQRRRMEAERAMEHAIVRVLAESSGLENAMERLIATICEAMGWAYGAHWSMKDDGVLHRTHHWSAAPLELEPDDAELWVTSDRDLQGTTARKSLARGETRVGQRHRERGKFPAQGELRKARFPQRLRLSRSSPRRRSSASWSSSVAKCASPTTRCST